jgi:uncharacterized protein YhfF
MAQTLRLKRSSVPGRVPTTATLQTGEIAINTADGLVYIRKDDDTIIPLLGANTTITGSITLLGSVEATSFTGSFSGSAEGLRGVVLDYSASAGDGMLAFTYNGSADAIISLDTGSNHFVNAVVDLIGTTPPNIIAQDTTGAGGIDLSYNSTTGVLSGSLLYSDIQLGSTSIQLGNSAASVTNFNLENTKSTGSFSGSFVGDLTGTLSTSASAGPGILPFTFDGTSNATVGIDSASYEFRKAVHDSIIIVDTYTSSGINLEFNEIGQSFYLSAHLQSPFMTVGSSYLQLSGIYESLSDLTLINTTASGSFTGSFTGNLEGTSSWAENAATASSADDFLVRGDLNVNGTVTAREFHTTFVSASIVYSSGSTKFGDTADDIHQFTGSVTVDGNTKSDDVTINDWGSISASLSSISTSASGQTLQQVTTNGNSTTLVISASNLNITDFPDVSASLASLGNYNLQNITDKGNSTTLVISASNLNITGFPDVSASLADLYGTSASFASELTLVSATASAAYNFTLQDITDNGNSTTLVVSASNLNITGFPDVSASLAAISGSTVTANALTLQEVTDNGNQTTNHVSISSSLNVQDSIYSKGEEVLDFAVAMAIALG